jgi:thiamine transport system ATP-binding protein
MERRRIDQLSGGQAQRVALARTLATRPKALLLDEPLGSLDPAYRRRVAGELSQLLRATAIPTIIVTHDAEEASALGDQIMVLDGGRSVVTGAPDVVWHDPGSAEAALMLGHTCVVDVRSTGTSVEVGNVSLPIAVAEDRATILIRRATIATDGGTPVTVAYSHFRGPGWVLGVRLGSAILEIESPLHIPDGREIQIDIDQEDVVVL